MANPQWEQGYLKLSNNIVQALVQTSLSGGEIRLVLWLIRLTYGFHRLEVVTNVTAFATKLKTSGDYAREMILNLEKKKVITCEWVSKDLCKLSFNKDFDVWGCFL